ncbi:PDZ and LIM domain protein Zasp isoform X5 [Maniola jurtina]|uniref:PDZ and LIM domain protein Zasp isoform X5 n=1 Tax=Maniola jurtina TaxID=191418 RepID=UPI001E688434|nr:PDZ and LIM domain protein Zasp isoform X5 [Maniola jurtina]
MAQLITVRLNKSDQQPLGFRLQGGKDFGTPLVVQKVNGGGAAERAGLQAGDALIRVNNTDVYTLRHQEAQDTIRAAGPTLELTVQRGGGTWRPAVTPTGSLPRPGSKPLGGSPVPVTNTSLKATPQPTRAFGSGHNSVAKPFGYMNGSDSVKSIVNKQYNTPVNMYSDKTIAETLSAQTEVLAGGVLGVNFKKNEKTYDAEKSAVFKVLQEAENDPEPEPTTFLSRARVARTGSPSVALRAQAAARSARERLPPRPASASLAPGAPHRPSIPVGSHRVLSDGRVALGAPAPAPPQLAVSPPPTTDTPYCSECNRNIDGVFVRIKDKNLHVECFKCATCGSSLKNQGYYNINGKLYCDIHAKLVARQNPPAPNLEPVTVSPGGRIPTNAYSTPLPPLSTNNYTNGSSSMFSPSSNLSGPKPFGSSIGSAYSPASLSPRSAPLSPARPLAAPAAPSPAIPAATPFAPTNETQTMSSQHKTEFKSPAEERLIRKMAKMALNGYEIGIQRKIKPADHIQSMADKIQDTVVTKHPLNSDSVPSGENSRESTLKRPLNKNVDKGYKSLDTSILNTVNHLTGNDSIICGNSHTPIPPPLPTTPVPTFQAHSTPIANILNNIAAKSPDYNLKLNNTINKYETPLLQSNIEKSQNGGYSSSDDSSKDKSECNFNTLKKIGSEKATIFNENNTPYQDAKKSELISDINFSNTLSKRKLFERNDAVNESSISENNFKMFDKINNSVPEKDHARKYNSSENSMEDIKSSVYQEENTKKLPNSLFDNTIYTYKSGKSNGIGEKIINNKNEHATEHIEHIKETSNSNHDSDNKVDSEEIVVRRRDKKNFRNDDGRRDSHIIARPLSTMTSVDVADGQYPVCHICDKAITRGPFITALGRIWCPEHFICVNATCRRQLQDIGFVEENGQLYCEYCFEQYIAPACDKCHAKIKGDCLNAIGKHFHPECFSCVYCGKLFGNNPFFLEDGLPYCEADWNELFTTKCFACGFPVEAGDRWVEALNNNYHSQCFNCTVCKKNLEGQSFFAKGGRPFCKLHAR